MSLSGVGSHSEKRQKTAESNVHFKLRFPQPQTARSMIEVIKEILPEISIDVYKDDTFSGIKIENIDDKRVCIVHVKLSCDVELLDEKAEFCISVDTLSICMRTVASHYVMDLVKYKGDDDIELTSRDATSGIAVNTCKMHTLCKDSTRAAVNPLDYDYTVQIDLSVFRSIVKISKDLNADNLSFLVYESKTAAGREILFCLRATGDASHEHYFRSIINEDGVICASEETHTSMEMNDDTLQYNDQFSVQYLNTFLKSMDRQVLTLRISKDKPLVLLYPLGAADSYVCFVLASKIED